MNDLCSCDAPPHANVHRAAVRLGYTEPEP